MTKPSHKTGSIDHKRMYKPKAGWAHLGGAVFERNGNRLHLLGLLRLENSTNINFNTWPYCVQFDRMVRINGGNRKRAAMAFADYLI